MEEIVVAGGCFWCLEAVFLRLKGVEEVESGYTGGETDNPTYEQVCSGRTGHAEAVRVGFNPREISLHDLLTIFFTLHDPTTVNRQGADVGSQYRSAIFYASEAQKEEAERVMEEIEAQELWPDSLVTELVPLRRFYPAEEYHRRFFERHPSQAYCQAIIAPKVAKLRKLFLDRLLES